MARRPEEADARPGDGGGEQRLDKWLWYARVAKTRTLAAGLVTDGKVRVNRQKVAKPAHAVRVGDVVTVSVARGVRVLRIEATGTRRGPATEARLLFDEIVPLPGGAKSAAQGGGEGDDDGVSPAQGSEGASGGAVAMRPGRPTKRDRRAIERLKPRFEDD